MVQKGPAAGGTCAMLAAARGRNKLQRNGRFQLETAISNVYGVADRTVNQPAGNVQADITERDVFWLRPGSITVTLL